MAAGAKLGHQDQFYSVGDGCVLGSDEFVDATIHRMGETERRPFRRQEKEAEGFEPERLIFAVEEACNISRDEFCGPGKVAKVLLAKETLIVAGRRRASMRELAEMTGLSSSAVGRRNDRAIERMRINDNLQKLTAVVQSIYERQDS